MVVVGQVALPLLIAGMKYGAGRRSVALWHLRKQQQKTPEGVRHEGTGQIHHIGHEGYGPSKNGLLHCYQTNYPNNLTSVLYIKKSSHFLNCMKWASSRCITGVSGQFLSRVNHYQTICQMICQTTCRGGRGCI